MTEFVLIKLQFSVVQTATLLKPEFAADFFQNMIQKTIFRVLPERFPHVVSARQLSLRSFDKASAKYFCLFLSKKLAGLQSVGFSVTEKEVFDKKHIELPFNSRGDYYYPTDNIFISMPIPRCQCRGFQVTLLSRFKDKDIKDKSFYLEIEKIQTKK